MSNNNQNQKGPPAPIHPSQEVALYQNLCLGWNSSASQMLLDQFNQQPGPSQPQHQQNGGGGDEEMETSMQMTPPNAIEPPRDTPPSKPRKSQAQKMNHPESRNLNHFQKTRLYMAFETLKRYPTDRQMHHAATDMNVEYGAVVEYFRDLRSRNGIPLPFDPLAVRIDGPNESNNNQFIPNAAPQPRAQKRASSTAPEFTSKCRRQDPEPME